MAAEQLSLSVECRVCPLSTAGGGERTDDDDIRFETASTTTLSSILSLRPLPADPPPLRGDEEAARRHRVAQAVHATWTQRGTEPAGLAEHFLDGSIDALDELVLGDAADPKGESGNKIEEESKPRDGNDGDGDEEGENVPLRKRCLGPGIAAVDASSLSYDDFVSRFLDPGVPVIIKGAATSWRSYREWGGWKSGSRRRERQRERRRCHRRRRLPLPLALAAAASADARAPVVDCDTGQRTEESVREFAERWARLERGGGEEEGEEEEGRLYLKDWHFCRPASPSPSSSSSSSSSPSAALEGGGESWYSVPIWFSDDWLNGAVLSGVSLRGEGGGTEEGGGGGGENADDVDDISNGKNENDFDDYRFIYAGPAATSTPLHADVLSTCSWSANVAGRKRWRLLAPEKTHFLFDRFGRELAPDFFPPTPSVPAAASVSCPSSSSSFPLLRLAPRHVTEVVQEAGDAIFVPPGWHHTVENLGAEDDGEEEGEGGDGDDGDDSEKNDDDGNDDDEDKNFCCGGAISINHNWFNAHSLRWVLELLRSERRSAADAIEDCRSTTTPLEFESLVQRNLGASAGMDYCGLARVLEWACERAERRCEALLLLARAAKSGGGDGGGDKGGEEQQNDSCSSSLLLARVLSCRLDASRARSAAGMLAEDLSLSFSDVDVDSSSPSSSSPPSSTLTTTTTTTAPAFVADAIERALLASRRALRAAKRAEEETGKSKGGEASKGLGREH